MPRRTPPERVVVSLYVNGNGANRATYESVEYISLQLCVVSLTETLWAWQAYKADTRPGKLCSWVSTGRSRSSQRSCPNPVKNCGMFCKVHCKHDAKSSAGDALRQENGAKNDVAVVSGSNSSSAGMTGEAACLGFKAKLYDAERKAENKIKWEEVFCKCCDAFPDLCEYARTEPGFDVRGEMYGDFPEHVQRKGFVREHAVRLTKTFQDEIAALLTARFAVDGSLKTVVDASNGYVKCLPEDGPFMSCAIVVALRAAHVAS